MKKLLFILLLIIPAFIINAQQATTTFKYPIKVEGGIQFSDGTVQTTASIPGEELATVQVIDHLYDKTSEAISELAKALEVPAEHVYNVLVRQQVIQSISGIIVFVLVSLICYIIMQMSYNDWKKTNKQWSIDNDRPNKTNYYDFDDNWWAYAFWTTFGIWITGFIVFLRCLGYISTGIFNPEYGAIKDIMSIL